MKKSAPKAKAKSTATTVKAKASDAVTTVSKYIQRDDVKDMAKGAGIAFLGYCVFSTLAS